MIGSFTASVLILNKDAEVGIILLEQSSVVDKVCDG